MVRTIRAFALVNQSPTWALKSAGDAKSRPGTEVSRNPLGRSTMPLNSGSKGIEALQGGGQGADERTDAVGMALAAAEAGLVVPDQPAWDPAELLKQLPRPQQQIFGVSGREDLPDHEPRVRGGDHHDLQQCRGAVLERSSLWGEPQVALRRVAWQPSQPVRTVDLPMLRPQWRTVSRNHVIEPAQPTRSAMRVAGMSGVAARNCRNSGANGVNGVGTAGHSYFGGRSEDTVRSTVELSIPEPRATCRCGTPSAIRRIEAQSQRSPIHLDWGPRFRPSL